MGIFWRYLDKRAAVAEAVRDYGRMQFIIEHTDDEVKAAYEKMGGIRSPQFDGMPHPHNPHAAEDRMAEGMDRIDALRERYRQAVEYMAWFRPAWDELAVDERYVLAAFYQDGGGAEAVCGHFQIERNSAYKKKNRALSKLSVLLFGR